MCVGHIYGVTVIPIKTDNKYGVLGAWKFAFDLHDSVKIFVVESLEHGMKGQSIDGLKGRRMYVILCMNSCS